MHSTYIIRASGDSMETALDNCRDVLEQCGDENNWYRELYCISSDGTGIVLCKDDWRSRQVDAKRLQKRIKSVQDAKEWAISTWVFDFNCICGYDNMFPASKKDLSDDDDCFAGITVEELLEPTDRLGRVMLELERLCYLARQQISNDHVPAVSVHTSAKIVADRLQCNDGNNPMANPVSGQSMPRSYMLYIIEKALYQIKCINVENWPFINAYEGDKDLFYIGPRSMQHWDYEDEEGSIETYLFVDIHT